LAVLRIKEYDDDDDIFIVLTFIAKSMTLNDLEQPLNVEL